MAARRRDDLDIDARDVEITHEFAAAAKRGMRVWTGVRVKSTIEG